ncbi:hypothetical protein FOCC_FOCC000317, partial [Frankliniella occidentalis]
MAAYSQPYSQLRPLQYLPELGRVGYYPYQATSTEFPGYHGYGPAALEASPHKLPATSGFPNRPSEGGGGSPTCAGSLLSSLNKTLSRRLTAVFSWRLRPRPCCARPGPPQP